MMGTLKIVLVGSGLMGKQHIKTIKQNPKCKLIAIVAPNLAPNQEVARIENIPIFPNLTDCLNRTDTSGVIIASPNQFHAEQAQICIKAGIPVLVEKPVTTSIADGKKLVELAAKYKAKVLVGHHRTYSPLLACARTIIQQGRIGKLVSIIGSAQFYKPNTYFEAGPWRKEPGGGPILINLIHEISNLRTLCGEISAVHAMSSSHIRGFAVEDTVAINLAFANGALGTFLLSDTAASAKSWEQTSQENPSYPSYTNEDCYSISGTNGSLAVPSMHLKYYPPDISPSWYTPFTEDILEVAKQDPLYCQLEHFLDVIQGVSEPLVSAEDGLKNLIATEAIRTSAKKRQLIYL
jgi:predicted dehydrogenase